MALTAKAEPWEQFEASQIRCAPGLDENNRGSKQKRFWEIQDWGSVPRFRSKLVEYCSAGSSSASEASSLRCLPDLSYCQARGLRLELPATDKVSSVDDPKRVQVSAIDRCSLSEDYPKSLPGLGGIRDWVSELRSFDGAPLRTGDDRGTELHCDIQIGDPTLIIKPDYRHNIYHGLHDHVNLFLSMWIADRAWAESLRVIYWEPDVISERVASPWYELYGMFTGHPVRPIGYYAGKSVCFRDVVFALNPRALRAFFTAMDVPSRPAQCRSARGGFMRSFAERAKARVLPRAPTVPKADGNVRITFLSRQGTRKVINEVELVELLQRRVKGIDVKLVSFDWEVRPTIVEQIAVMAETDILIGMHGAGLVHTLWLPEWATVFEIYECGMKDYFGDLARLMGVGHLVAGEKHVAAQRSTKIVPKEHLDDLKFQDYIVDPESFVTYVKEALHVVRTHPASPFGKENL